MFQLHPPDLESSLHDFLPFLGQLAARLPVLRDLAFDLHGASANCACLHHLDGFLRCIFEVTAISIRLACRMQVSGCLNVPPFLLLELMLDDQLLEIPVLLLFEHRLLFR